MGWQNTYLGRLWRQRRPLFWLMVFLLLGHLIPVLLNYPILSPFYEWGMYTRPMNPSDSFLTYEIRYNDDKLLVREHAYRDLGRMMWLYTLPFYDALLTTGDTVQVQTKSARAFTKAFSRLPHSLPIHVTDEQVKQYPSWLLRYLEQETGEPVYRLEVSKLYLMYQKDGRVKASARKKFIQLP